MRPLVIAALLLLAAPAAARERAAVAEDLCGRIEGVVDGAPESLDWRYRRAP